MTTTTTERPPGMTLTLDNAPEGTVLAFGSPTYPCHARRRAGRWWVAAGTPSAASVPLHACDVLDVVFVPGPPVRWARHDDGRPDLAGEPRTDRAEAAEKAAGERALTTPLPDGPTCACPGICYRCKTLGRIGRPAPVPGSR